ncbi:MAG: antibiotic biosynthesis monooxygenase family protein [Alkalilacustris sp.]
MHALFFEMRPKPGHLDHYFAHVARLRPLLERHTGLWWLQRFRATDDPELILSHQHWADEEAILGWRRDPEHRRSQEAGRRVHFDDYRIRVGPELASGFAGDSAVPVLVTVLASAALPDMAGARVFESLTEQDTTLTLVEAQGAAEARSILHHARSTPGLRAARAFVISRDYGLTDRAAAPA